MIKKIPIEELEPGMYVCGLERPGDSEVDYFMNNIRVDSADDVRRFKDSGYSSVHVDLPDEPLHTEAPPDPVKEAPGPVDLHDVNAAWPGPSDQDRDEWAKPEDGPIFFDTALEDAPETPDPPGPVEGEPSGLAEVVPIETAAPLEESSLYTGPFEDACVEAPGAVPVENDPAVLDNSPVGPEPAGPGEHCNGSHECECGTEGPDKKKAKKGCACGDEDEPWSGGAGGGGADRAGGAGSR